MLPTGFTAVKDATAVGSRVSLLGVIISIKEQRKTKGTDWVLEFTIQDDFTNGSVGSGASINCRLFRPSPDKFPKINGVGDIALLRNFGLDGWMDRVDAVWKPQSGVLVFPASGIPVPELSQAYQVGSQNLPYSAVFGTKDSTAQEQMAVIQLKHSASGSVRQVKQYAAASSSVRDPVRDRLSLIKDLTYDRFYDVRAQVVNIYYNNYGTVDLKVTDYTTNKDLFLYVDPDDEDWRWQQDKAWKGPCGQLTMNVLLYGNSAVWSTENLAVGDYVFLRNVHTKMSQANKLEGVLHEDKQRPNAIDIRKLVSVTDIKEIKDRQQDYDKKRVKKTAFEDLQNEPKKSSAKASAKKKAEKKARQRAEKEQEQRELAEKAEKWEADRNGVNINIRAAFPEVQPSTISEILYNPHRSSRTTKYNEFTLAFLNCRHRSRVRVVDFFPPELDLFGHCTADPSWDKRAKNVAPGDSHRKQRWEWGFVLLLEDAKVPPDTVSEKLCVVVGNEAGQHLLDMNAQDLKNDRKALKRLEEKLFILWGNLFELKTELRLLGSDMPLPPGDNRLQNKPFDCCIEEYGHEVPMNKDNNPAGYQRMHRLAGTRIMTNI
ncbi:hypothetical protein EK21DRAFT_63799 [Setomelanomma holmii]|uniref:Protection of telomeres protein 1 n=1 Tax=Setomelanomma holmii TaxID=210430 RepID=A0A9P4HDQ8_9PLEO|nr:hypothetical protein EK21DRAFT_63799 [Setomelanomma holmii]